MFNSIQTASIYLTRLYERSSHDWNCYHLDRYRRLALARQHVHPDGREHKKDHQCAGHHLRGPVALEYVRSFLLPRWCGDTPLRWTVPLKQKPRQSKAGLPQGIDISTRPLSQAIQPRTENPLDARLRWRRNAPSELLGLRLPKQADRKHSLRLPLPVPIRRRLRQCLNR